MMGPAIGEIVRDIYQRNRTFTDVTGLRVERFSKAELRPERNVI